MLLFVQMNKWMTGGVLQTEVEIWKAFLSYFTNDLDRFDCVETSAKPYELASGKRYE